MPGLLILGFLLISFRIVLADDTERVAKAKAEGTVGGQPMKVIAPEALGPIGYYGKL